MEALREGDYRKACEEIARIVAERGEVDERWLAKLKGKIAEKYSLTRVPSNVEVILNSPKEIAEKIRKALKKKPVRSISGIVVVSIMTQPHECPHGRCSYCPRFPGAPVSYTGREPAAMRGIQNNFDPALQFTHRIRQLEAMGHRVDKVDVIIQGGTFNATPLEYKEWFMMRLLEGVLGFRPESYEVGLRLAEKAKYRITGMTIETRPDQCDESQVDWMLEKGFTRVELGVQTTYDDVYREVRRGHSIKDVIEATRRLKDAGFKICYHMMPGLPRNDFLRDLNSFRSLVESESFRPDMLKIYPTLVLEGTELYDWWASGKYRPYSVEEALVLISAVKANFVPPWIRIMRVQRDIPVMEIVDGVKKGNLRELVSEHLLSSGLRCKCIRCREVGHKTRRGEIRREPHLEIVERKYPASRGIEYFISVEDVENDALVGFVRLRRPSERAWRPEIVNYESFIVRELHVYGEALSLGERSSRSWQHRGVGSTLLKRAEEIALEDGGEKILVLSGVGVKEYYYSHGYMRDGPYVSKLLS